jgi:hypothetical protein
MSAKRTSAAAEREALHSRRVLLSRSAIGIAALAGAGTLACPAPRNRIPQDRVMHITP